MADYKDEEKTIQIDVVIDDAIDIGYQADKSQQDKETQTGEVKQKAGEFAKAAGGLAGAVGKFAMKKGSELKDKLEDEEFQEKAKASVKKVSSKAATSATKAAEKATALAETTAKNLESRANAKKTESANKKTVPTPDESSTETQVANVESKHLKSDTNSKKGKKTTEIWGIALLLLIAIGCFAISKGSESNEVNKYDTAVQMIVDEQYDKAIEELDGLAVEDSESIIAYARIQNEIDSYMGHPDEMWSDISDVKGVENEQVRNQIKDAHKHIEKAEDVQTSIDFIRLDTIYDKDREALNNIEKSIETLERYEALIDAQNLERAKSAMEHLEKDDNVGNTINQIRDIGEVTLDSEEAINKARESYDSLSEEEKNDVINYEDLTYAESSLDGQKKKKSEKEAEDMKKAEEDEVKDNYTVYVSGGDRYHFDGCRHLGSNRSAMTQGQAIASGYYPCQTCVNGHDVPSYYYARP